MSKRLTRPSIFVAAFPLLFLAGVCVLTWQKFSGPSGVDASEELVARLEISAADINGQVAAVAPEALRDSGVPKDGIPSLDMPAFVPVSQAVDELALSGTGLVVVKESVARFYPYQILAWHEVVNDVVAGTPMAITYCALCNVGVVYERRLDGRELSFGVSGKLHELDSLLYDRTTHSLWSQVTGEAISGDLAGKKLAQVSSPAITLQEFAAQYPSGQVLSKFTGFVRNYDDLSYGDYASRLGGEAVIAAKGLWHPKTEVVGVEIQGKYKAYPAAAIGEKAIIDEFEGVQLVLAGKQGALQVTNMTAGSERASVAHVSMHWFMWQAWHPDTEQYKALK